jgi:hypothetical protein
MSKALTILSAFLKSGGRLMNLKPYGSFEGWSSVVREAVIWIGLPDPCLTRTKLAESADTSTDALKQLIAAWRAFDYPASKEQMPQDPASIAMRAALENLTNVPPGKVPTAKQIGNKLRQFRRRVAGGVMLDTDIRRTESGKVWRLISA